MVRAKHLTEEAKITTAFVQGRILAARVAWV